MPKVTITKQTKVAATEAFKLVKTMLDDNKDLKKLDPSYKCVFNESNLTGSANGKMFKADMNVKTDGNGSAVEIIVDLPFALSLAKGLVQKTLQKKLDESLS